MPTFLYRGYNAHGQRIGGSLRAAGRGRAEAQITQWGVTDFTVYTSKTRFGIRPYALVSPDELALFCRETALIAASGLAPAEGFHLMAEQTKNADLKQACAEMAEYLSAGFTLAGALCMFGHVFGAFLPHVAAAGESAGNLCGALEGLHTFYTREARLRKKLYAMLLYPIIRLVLIWGVVLHLLSACLPAIAQLLTALGPAAAPVALLRMTQWLYGRGWIVALLLLTLGAYLVCSWRFRFHMPLLDRMLLYGPVLRRIALPLYTERLAQAYALLLLQQTPPEEAAHCLFALFHNRLLEQKLMKMMYALRAGQPLPKVMDTFKHMSPCLSPVFFNMALMGSHTGRMIEIMTQASDWFAMEAERAIDQTAAWLEPALMLLFSLTAGLPLLCLLLPLTEALQKL